MMANEINYHLDNCLILRMIEETHFDKFVEAVQEERALAAGLLTWEAAVHLAVHKYFGVQRNG